MRFEIHQAIDGKVRCSSDHKFTSIDDTVSVFCPKLGTSGVNKVVADSIGQLKEHCSLQHKMGIEGDGSQGWSSCVAVDTEYLPHLLSLLPREEVDFRLWPILQVAEREKAKLEFIEENTPLWEAVGRILKEFREDLGMSIKQVATAIRVSPSVIRNVEAGLPIQRARLVERAYWWFLKYHWLSKTSSRAI